MSDPSELYVEVYGGQIIVTLPHSTYIATYCKRTDSPHLTMAPRSFNEPKIQKPVREPNSDPQDGAHDLDHLKVTRQP